MHAAQILAATVGIAGLLQLSMLVLRRGESIATPLRISFDKEIRGFLGKAIPGMIASSAPQLLMVAGAIIASASPSAVSWLYFANRLIELPLGIVGVAMGTVLIPELTRAVRSDDRAAVAHAESRGLELAVGLALPATLGLIVLGEPIVRLLFEHGAFTADDTAATAHALMWLALALPAHVLVKALSPAFFAREDTMTPLLAALKGVVVAIAAAFLLGHWFGAERHRCRHRARRLEHRDLPDPPRHRDVRLFGRCRTRNGGCRASCSPRSPWARCCGWRRGRCRPRPSAHGLIQASCCWPDRGGNCDLWPVPAAPRRRRLARGG